VEAVQPIGNPYIGVGQGDPGAWPWLMGGFEVVKAGRLDTVKLLAGDNLEVDYKVMDTLYGLGVKFVVARLFYAGAPASSQQFIDSFINSAVNLYRKGVRWFEVHNEPNLLAEWTGTPEEWAAFMREVIQLLRPAMPEAKFLYPGLSPGGADASVACLLGTGLLQPVIPAGEGVMRRYLYPLLLHERRGGTAPGACR